MGKKFDLAELISGQNPGVSGSDTSREQITYIPFVDILPDENNGYSMDGLEDLARSIEIAGLQQPLRVRPIPEEPGRYRIVSGHRRHSAIYLLIEQGSEQFVGGVPCIVDAGTASPALRELQLLLGNADNRKLTSADQEQQAERISDCLRRLEDEGYEFPGRHRDWVSKLSGLSRTKLARLQAIKNNLLPDLYRDYYRKNKMRESVAYAFSQQPAEDQQRIVAMFAAADRTPDRIYEHDVSTFAEQKVRLAKLTCKNTKGGPCTNQERMLKKIVVSTGYSACRWHNTACCHCSEYLNCKYRCPLLDEKAKAERAKKRAESADQRSAEKAKADADAQRVREVWARFGQALTSTGLGDGKLREQLKAEGLNSRCETYLDKKKVKALLGADCEDVKSGDPLPFGYDFKAWDAQRLCAFADALGCSLDYLFCRTDTPRLTSAADDVRDDTAAEAEAAPEDPAPLTETPAAAASSGLWPEWISVKDALPPEGVAVLTLDKGGDIINDRLEIADGQEFWCYSVSVDVTHWMPSPPPPGSDRTIGRAVLAVEAETAYTPFWRPFPREKPQEGQRALVVQEPDGYERMLFEAKLARFTGGKWLWVSEVIPDVEAERVTHWLPEPAFLENLEEATDDDPGE